MLGAKVFKFRGSYSGSGGDVWCFPGRQNESSQPKSKIWNICWPSESRFQVRIDTAAKKVKSITDNVGFYFRHLTAELKYVRETGYVFIYLFFTKITWNGLPK